MTLHAILASPNEIPVPCIIGLGLVTFQLLAIQLAINRATSHFAICFLLLFQCRPKAAVILT